MKLPKSRIIKINATRRAARKNGKDGKDEKNGMEKFEMFENFGKKSCEKKVSTPVEIRINGYRIYHFPNLRIFAKVKHETWLTGRGYQPSESSLKKVTPEFVSKVLAAKIEGRL